MEVMEPGAVIADKYLLVRQIGRGGMGAVWAARNVRTEREIALKLITDENRDYRERLLREARACGRISHRNVIEIYDVGETASGAPFLVMPLLEGEPLSRKLRRDGAMPSPIAAQIASEIARALGAAHAAGIVHRDLKPANIYLHREPGAEMIVVKVLDFGISKVVATDSTTTTTGTILGSPAYMSPEQARGDRYVDHRSDLWALGVTLFEMLTGQRPFQGESMFTVVAAVLDGPIPHVRQLAPHIDPGLADVVTRCMVREMHHRAQAAEEIAHLLRPYAAGYLPVDLSAFGASGFHPAPSMSAAPPGAPLADSASMPPVHFAPRPPVPVPPPGPPRASFPSISLHTGSISGMAAPAPQAAGVNAPDSFSGSTTAAGSMVHGVGGAPRTPIPQSYPPFGAQPAPSPARWLVVVGVAFIAAMVVAGVVLGLSSSRPVSSAGPGEGAPSAGATSGAAPSVPVAAVSATATAEPTPSASSGTQTEVAVELPATDVDPRGAGAQPVTGAGAGAAKPASTAAKPAVTTTRPVKPKGGGVAVPDDPG